MSALDVRTLAHGQVDLGNRIRPRVPARHPPEQFHIVSGNNPLPLRLSDDALDIVVGSKQIPAIALMVSRRPHAFDIGKRGDGVAGYDIGTLGGKDLNPLRSESVGVYRKMQSYARTHLMHALDQGHPSIGDGAIELDNIVQIHR